MRSTRSTPILGPRRGPTRGRIPGPLLSVLAVLVAIVLALGLTTSSASAALPKHKIKVGFTRITNHKFVVHGKVTLVSQRFTVLERRAHTRKFVPLEQPRTSVRGRFRFTVTGAKGDCFQIRLPSTTLHRATVVSLGCIHVIS